MNWVQTDCSCPSNLKCLRPVLYSKPTFCVPEKILPENFEKYVSNPLQFFHQNCTNMDTTVLFIILVSIFFQLVSFVFVTLKKCRRPVITRQFVDRPHHQKFEVPEGTRTVYYKRIKRPVSKKKSEQLSKAWLEKLSKIKGRPEGKKKWATTKPTQEDITSRLGGVKGRIIGKKWASKKPTQEDINRFKPSLW
uniref:Uncharacterized protein n=1 Tax=Meloidogyne hapla TaxID=6305 RepID=A0A1I8AZG5_MELHA